MPASGVTAVVKAMAPRSVGVSALRSAPTKSRLTSAGAEVASRRGAAGVKSPFAASTKAGSAKTVLALVAVPASAPRAAANEARSG